MHRSRRVLRGSFETHSSLPRRRHMCDSRFFASFRSNFRSLRTVEILTLHAGGGAKSGLRAELVRCRHSTGRRQNPLIQNRLEPQRGAAQSLAPKNARRSLPCREFGLTGCIPSARGAFMRRHLSGERERHLRAWADAPHALGRHSGRHLAHYRRRHGPTAAKMPHGAP